MGESKKLIWSWYERLVWACGSKNLSSALCLYNVRGRAGAYEMRRLYVVKSTLDLYFSALLSKRAAGRPTSKYVYPWSYFSNCLMYGVGDTDLDVYYLIEGLGYDYISYMRSARMVFLHPFWAIIYVYISKIGKVNRAVILKLFLYLLTNICIVHILLILLSALLGRETVFKNV